MISLFARAFKPNFVRYKSDYFITTPIYYVNADPHIGHLYSSLIADAHYRFQLLLGKTPGVFSTGTDEHGTKVQQAASSHDLTPEIYCTKISAKYKELCDIYGISYSHFVRTSSKEHKENVRQFWDKLASRGHITLGTYSGWYCDADEAFLTDAQVTKISDNNIISTESGRQVHWVEETNYKFEISKFKADVKEWIQKGSIRPKKFQDLALFWIEDGVMDRPLSISRPLKRVYWSVQVPGDEEHGIYVWLDALVNYLTVAKKWPPDVQILGKDILKFHGIYWPAFLIAAGLEPPSSLLVHSHWTVEGEKMSKSKGNVVCPFDYAQRFTPSGLRYFLLREGTPQSDSSKSQFFVILMWTDFSDTKMLRILNSELADTFGNLLSRNCGLAVNKDQIYPAFVEQDYNSYCKETASDLISSLETLSDQVHHHYSEFNFYKGVDEIMNTLRLANKFVDTSKPWELKKNPDLKPFLNTVIHVSLETVRICGIALLPIVPILSTKVLDKISISPKERLWSNMIPSWKQKTFKTHSSLSEEKLIFFKKLQVK